MKRILGALFLALALGGALAVALPASTAEAGPGAAGGAGGAGPSSI